MSNTYPIRMTVSRSFFMVHRAAWNTTENLSLHAILDAKHEMKFIYMYKVVSSEW